MSGFDRESLIGNLAAEFDKDKGLDVPVEKSNFVETSGSLNCSALRLPLETLEKTRFVAENYLEVFKEASDKDKVSSQKMMYMEVAIKCIDEVIAIKMKRQELLRQQQEADLK